MNDATSPSSTDQVTQEQAQRSLAAAHRPGSALAGPYGRPLHPLLVTVPIGAFVATIAFDVASLLSEGRAFGRPAVWLAAIGVVSGLFAAIFGFLDFRRLTPGTVAHRTAVRHMVLMDVVLIAFIVSFFLRRADPDQYLDGTPIAAFVVAVAGLLVLAVGVWTGGRLSNEFGVRVVDEADQLAAHVVRAPSRPDDAGSS